MATEEGYVPPDESTSVDAFGHPHPDVGQVDDSPAERVTAPEASCRSQLGKRDVRSETPPHPVEMLGVALAD